MDYLKKYRQEAGLVSDNQKRFSGVNSQVGVATPTRETLDYLAGAVKNQQKGSNGAHLQNDIKTPGRNDSPYKKDLVYDNNGLKSSGRLRQSGVKPFNRIDTNMQKSSSRKSIKQGSNQSKKQQSIYSNMVMTTLNSTPFSTNEMQHQRPSVAAHSTSSAAPTSKSSYQKRVPTKSQVTTGTKRQNFKKNPSDPTIFPPSSHRKSTQQLVTSQGPHAGSTPKNSSNIFMQEVTAGHVKRKIGDHQTQATSSQNYQSNHGQTTNHNRKKSSTQPMQQKKKRGSPVSETASEKAVRDAMMKTTQKIYFPKAFQMPGNKNGKKDKAASIAHAQEHRHQQSQQHHSPAKSTRRTVVNLESQNSELEMQMSSGLFPIEQQPQPQPLIELQSPIHHQASYCDKNTNQILAFQDNPHLLDEQSYNSLDNFAETQTNTSKLSCGRRSRKDRSKGKSGTLSMVGGRNAVTPHLQSDNHHTSITAMTETGISPNVRMMPGSDAISLELDIKGMTEPNRNFEEINDTQDNQTQASSRQPAQPVPPIMNKGGSHNRNVSSTFANSRNSLKQQQNNQTQGVELRGALNAFVQQKGTRSRTPLTFQDKYAAQQQSSKTTQALNGQEVQYSGRLADKNIRPSNLANAHKKNVSTNAIVQATTPTKVAVQSNLPKSALRQRENSFIASGNNNLTPLRQVVNHQCSDITPTRLAFERNRFSHVTATIDRASESLEKVNEVFRQVSVGTFDAISMMRKPAKVDIDGCQIFCRFVNAFRHIVDQWNSDSLQTWQQMMSFLLYSPNCQKICLEIQQIKKRVLRPHIIRIAQETYDQLSNLRETMMSHFNEKSVNVQYKNSSVIRKMVMLVLVSINHLIPIEKEPEEQPETAKEEDVELRHEDNYGKFEDAAQVQDIEVADQEALQQKQNEEIIAFLHTEVEQAESPQKFEPSAAIVDSVWNIPPKEDEHVQNHGIDLSLKNDEDDVELSESQAHSPAKKLLNETVASAMRGGYSHETSTSGGHHGKSRQSEALANRYAKQDDEEEDEEEDVDNVVDVQRLKECEMVINCPPSETQQMNVDGGTAEDIDSSKGSAWPSETSRLTPHQSTYQVTITHQVPVQVQQQKEVMRSQHITQAQTLHESATLTKKEEPMTEMKRVPYRITDRADCCGMFEDFSCSSELEKQQQPQQFSLPVPQPQKQDIPTLDILKTTSIAQMLNVNTALSKHERIAQLQAAQQLIQQQIAELLQMETSRSSCNLQKEDEEKKDVEQASVDNKCIHESSPEFSSLSPVHLVQTLIESPNKLSAIKASLAIKQETVEKELDSILGESPSPSKQVDRADWNLVSPEKFVFGASPDHKFQLKLGRVAAIAEEGTTSHIEASETEMSSHDLSAEEKERDEKVKNKPKGLQTFTEVDSEKALESQRDRQTSMLNLHQNAEAELEEESSIEKTCDEIRMSFGGFSPTKIMTHLVKKPVNEAVQRFQQAIEKHERVLQDSQNLSLRQQLDNRLKERLTSRTVSKEQTGQQDSPNTRDRKYKQMQNDIYAKIQAQLKNM